MRSTSSLNTRVLPCDPTSISFPPLNTDVDEQGPIISSQETIDSLNAARHQLLTELQPIAFPTETVYGLGAVAQNTDAVLRIFSTKGRPADNPLIVHVSSLSMLRRLLPPSYIIPPTYNKLIHAFWPGALTLLFPANPSIIPSIITAGQPTVAIRMPSHPVARALIALCDKPLAAPSANSSGKPSPTRADHVFRDLGGKIPIILDGGACELGLESTVVDGLHPDGHLRVLRPGGITVEDLQSVISEGVRVLVHKKDFEDKAIEAVPTTPGMKYRHYAPSVPVILLMDGSKSSQSQTMDSFITSIISPSPLNQPLVIGVLFTSDSPFNPLLEHSISHHPRVSVKTCLYGSRADPQSTAHRLFDGLLTLDREGADIILVEGIAEDHEGLAVMNRVRKAAGETRWISLASTST